MSDSVVLGSASALVIVAILVRPHAAFVTLWLLVVAGFALLHPGIAERPLDHWLALSGLVLLGPGLLGIRIVLVRSVSFAMLRGELDESAITERITRRVGELRRLGLAVDTNRGLELTSTGRLLGRLMDALYSLLGHRT